jgi:cyclin-dependent kinase-like
LLVGDLNYNKAVDVWAIGCIFLELVTGRPLFAGDSDYDTLKLILETFNGIEELPQNLKSAFYENEIFQNASLPEA